MALAYLMKQAAEEGVAYKDSLRAFIVDHKARNESSEEAKMVKGNLQSLGVSVFPFPSRTVVRRIEGWYADLRI